MLFNGINYAIYHSADEATADLELQNLLTRYAVSICEVMIQVERKQQILTVSAPRQQAESALLLMAGI